MFKIMNLRKKGCFILLSVLLVHVVGGNVVFNVEHKFGGRGRAVLKELKAHDVRRHGRMLAPADFQLGGNGNPTGSGLYFARISIGTPSKDYHVQIELTQYNIHASTSGKSITCEQDVCAAMFEGESSECKVGKPCEFEVKYADGTKVAGNFVKDRVNLDQVSGDYKTSPLQGNIAFGCASKQSGDLAGSSKSAVDGIIGFGSLNSSLISQLAASGTVKKKFAHCLDGVKGGGIFAIGQVVEPHVNSVPLLSNKSHYTLPLDHIEVGGQVLNIPTYKSESKSSQAAILDSATTLAYIPSKVYKALIDKLREKQPELKIHRFEGVHDCFKYSGKIDDGFPAVTFKFKGNLSLTAYPHDYLHENEGQWCFGWQDGAEVKSPPASLLALEEWRKASLLWPFSLILNCVATLIIP
ncbi:putative eukaryotic translation initiation factor 5B-like [Capsicum annuum]|nr:putative eukaryotic translation initiation factor 5B-like [Capsicum annuum]